MVFDLSQLPAHDRFPFWRDQGSLLYRPRSEGLGSETPLAVRSEMETLGAITLASMEASPQHYERTAAMLRRDGQEHYLVALLEHGQVEHAVAGRVLRASPGDLLLLDLSQEASSRWSAHTQIFAAIPRELISPTGAREIRSGLLTSEHPYTRLLSSHLRSLKQELHHTSMAQRPALAQGLAALVRTYFANTHGLKWASETALESEAGSDDLLLLSMQRWIIRNLHRSDLNAALISSQFHLSRSSLYRLFEPFGGVRHYIQEQRLTLALLRLRNRQTQGSLAALAGSLGFASASSFSHAFRRRWGMAPRECLGAAMAERPEAPAPGQMGEALRDGTNQQLRRVCERYYRGITVGNS